MKEYDIQSSILTILRMGKQRLITKETYQQASEGKLKKDPNWEDYDGSINDDIDSYFEKFLNQEKIKNEQVASFFLPKLTKEELKLVEEIDREYMRQYLFTLLGMSKGDKTAADVDVEEMKQSDSKDKYAQCRCVRQTINLTLQRPTSLTSSQRWPSKTSGCSETSSDISASSHFDDATSDDFCCNYEINCQIQCRKINCCNIKRTCNIM